MENKVVISKENINGKLEVYLPSFGNWRNFDTLIRFLEEEYEALILKEDDGVYTRKWIVKVKESTLEVVYDGAQCIIIAQDPKSKLILNEIAGNLNNKLNYINHLL